MRSFAISVYSIQMSDHMQVEKYPLGDLPNGQDLCDLLYEYFNQMKSTVSNDSVNQEMLKVASFTLKGRTICGTFERGEYGYASKLVNVSSQRTSYKRKIEDAELLPYYFLTAIPKHQSLGLFAVQRSGLSGIKLPIERSLREFLLERCPDCKLIIERIVPSKAIEQYMQRGKVSKIRFVKYGIPNDLADFIQDGHEENNGTIEYHITPRMDVTSAVKERIANIVSRRQNINDFMKIHDFEYNTVKVEINIGGKHRTVDLSDPSTVKADYDITNEVEIKQGVLAFESVDAIAREIVNEIVDSMRLEVNGVQQN